MQTPSKDTLILDLQKSFRDTIDWISAQPESQFNETIVPDKWTIAGHLFHLVKSTKGVSRGISMPKLGLRTMFGKAEQVERSFEELSNEYKAKITEVGFKTTGDFEPKAGRTFERSVLIKRFQDELTDFEKALEKWNDEELSAYVMPHPAIGKCTIREFVYFTIIHTYHHLHILKEKYVVDA